MATMIQKHNNVIFHFHSRFFFDRYLSMNALSDLQNTSKWLDVQGSVGQGINTLPSNIVFTDLFCDSDYKLLIGDIGSSSSKPKLKIFKGTSVINEIILPDIPTCVVSFFTSESVPRNAPVVAVSMGSCVYIYKNAKLFYKFHLPPLEIEPLETDIWRQFYDCKDDEAVQSAVEKLLALPLMSLSSESQHLLSLTPDKYLNFIKQRNDAPLQKFSIVTCMTTLKVNSVEKDGVACLVLGTENGDITLLDPQTFTVLHQARTSSNKAIPTHLDACGLYDVEYRIIIATREGLICVLKREWLEGKCLIQLPSLPVSLMITPGDNSIVVACMDKTLHCYSKKGKRNWMVTLPGVITTTVIVPLIHLGTNLIGVGMVGGLIHFYNGKNHVDVIQMNNSLSSMSFGQIGQEEHVLALVTSDGALSLKILKRTADFNLNAPGGSQKNQLILLASQKAKPLMVPKKSKLFLEQAAREREQAGAMHDTFQRELCQLRLYVAKATLEAIRSANTSITTGNTDPLKLSAQVQGLGPVFSVHLSIENLSTGALVIGLSLLLVADHRYYKIISPFITVPMLVPGHPFTFISKVEDLFFIDDTVENVDKVEDYDNDVVDPRSVVKVILLKDGQVQPLLAANIVIPPTDPLMIPFT